MNDMVTREELNHRGMRAVGGIGGGVAVWVVEGILGLFIGVLRHIPLLGGLIGAAGGLVGGLLGLVGFGLVVFGGFNLVKFVKGLKSRS